MIARAESIIADFTHHSIVFSYWTSTLDALSELLAERGIKYVQVDGRTDKVKRAMNLKDFQTYLSLSVLVMSVETGAVG